MRCNYVDSSIGYYSSVGNGLTLKFCNTEGYNLTCCSDYPENFFAKVARPISKENFELQSGLVKNTNTVEFEEPVKEPMFDFKASISQTMDILRQELDKHSK